jgi:TRAP-type C4-dicarboxylate transport system permease small subunit
MRIAGRVIVRITVGLAYVGGLIWLLLMILTVVDIVRRTGLIGDGAWIAVAEVTEVVQVIPIFLGLAYAEYTGAHVRTGIVTTRLPLRTANAVRSVSMLLVVAVLVVMTGALTQHAIDSTIEGEFRFGVGHVVVWPSRIVAAFGSFAMLVVCVLKLVDLIRATLSTTATSFLPEPADEDVAAQV